MNAKWWMIKGTANRDGIIKCFAMTIAEGGKQFVTTQSPYLHRPRPEKGLQCNLSMRTFISPATLEKTSSTVYFITKYRKNENAKNKTFQWFSQFPSFRVFVLNILFLRVLRVLRGENDLENDFVNVEKSRFVPNPNLCFLFYLFQKCNTPLSTCTYLQFSTISINPQFKTTSTVQTST